MKVTLINTADAGGGAPEACMRLAKALRQTGVDAQLEVLHKKTAEPFVSAVGDGFLSNLKARFNFLLERLPFIWFKAKDRSLRFAFSTANTGTDISNEPAVKDADILHLHWTNFGFLAIKDLEKLLETGKPIVWTLHDMWAFTGGCHYSGDCNHFTNHCGNCWMLRDAGENDISHRGWMEKTAMYPKAKNIAFVTCSNWLAELAKTSSLLADSPVFAIPNPIDTSLFCAKNKQECRDKWGISHTAKVVIFGAANILDRRKGLTHLVNAFNQLKTNYSDIKNIEVVLFGKNKSFDVTQIPFKVYEIGVITAQEEMAMLYNTADVFVNPSIEDNLPNTIMEALSCGIPVVAFNTGGIPDMVEHRHNGYLAEYKSDDDLAAGINYVLSSDTDALKTNARKKVLDNFTNEIVAAKYLAVYQSILDK